MASFEKYADKMLRLEGGYVNHPKDKGGPTKYGVILATWKEYGYDKDNDGDIDADDIKLLTEEDAKFIAKTIFWDYFQADKILNQTIAEFIVDWGYNSGRRTAALNVQRLIQVSIDGVFGKITLSTINGIAPEVLLDKLKAARKAFVENIVMQRPDQHVFYKGWINRINSFKLA